MSLTQNIFFFLRWVRLVGHEMRRPELVGRARLRAAAACWGSPTRERGDPSSPAAGRVRPHVAARARWPGDPAAQARRLGPPARRGRGCGPAKE